MVISPWNIHQSCNAQLFSTCTDASFSFCRLLPWPPSHNALRCLQTPPPPPPAQSSRNAAAQAQLILESLEHFKVFISSCYFSLAATVNIYYCSGDSLLAHRFIFINDGGIQAEGDAVSFAYKCFPNIRRL